MNGWQDEPGPPADLDADELRLLLQLGLHAAFGGRTALALRLFDALAQLRPQASFPTLGRAMALLAARRLDEAVRQLETTVSSHPDDDDARVLLGFALRLTRRQAQAQQVLAPLLNCEDGPVTRLARELTARPVP